MTPLHLVVEGWRTSSHSYALVNQHQLLHLTKEPDLRVSHVDVPFFRPHWAQIDSGLSREAKAVLAGIGRPREPRADAIYRISWPLRIHGGEADKVFVFGTSEFQRLKEHSLSGPSGSDAGVDMDAVDIITPSSWSREGFVTAGFKPSRVHVIPHGVDPVRFHPASAAGKSKLRALLKIPETAFVFLNVSAMTWNKGIGPLLAAFAAYSRLNPRAMLVLKGGDALYGNQMDPILAEAAQLNPAILESSVMASLRYMPENLSQAQIAALYQASDAYISPYRAEGFNLPVLEALACGIPALVTAGGPTDEFCPAHLGLRIAATAASGPVGNYLEPDPNSIFQCMQLIAADDDLRANALIEGPRWITDHYSWSRVTAALVDLLAHQHRQIL
jgi:glycosyltransferase involved in cell wall biosynthesis